MNQAHLITALDFEDGCPIPAEALGRIYRADAETQSVLLRGIPQRTRAHLAIFLYGRIHTRDLGVRVAATCEAALLMQTAGALGEAIYAQSRDGYAHPHKQDRRPSKGSISLAGPRRTAEGYSADPVIHGTQMSDLREHRSPIRGP